MKKVTTKPTGEDEITADDLPEGWAEATLGTLANLISGAGFPINEQGRKGLKYPFFKVGSLGQIDSDQELAFSVDTISEATAQKLGAKIIPKGAVLFAKIGMAIALNRRRLTGVPCCIDNNLIAAVPTKAVASRYLLRFLETYHLWTSQAQLRFRACGSRI